MLDKDSFFNTYPIMDAFRNSGLSWDNLCEIYSDYKVQYYDTLQDDLKDILDLLGKDKPEEIRAIYGRVKTPEHLIEKIIRKAGLENSSKYRSINKDSYRNVITDLVGIRILVLAKEEWNIADTHVRKCFNNTFVETPTAYVCYGDREIFDENILYVTYTNKGYRSQHYIVRRAVYCAEIQVRTLAEEVYGEFDHRARYPYRNDNKFLTRYSKIVSKVVTQLDDLVSTCLDIRDDKVLIQLGQCFREDTYPELDKKIKQHYMDETQDTDRKIEVNNARDLANNKLLRKGE